jgi:tetratricopeptide (TPR) repeat protein
MDVDLLFRKGVLLDKMERKYEAIEMMEKVLEIDPRNANALNYIGYTYADMGLHLTKAKRMIMRALELEPEDGYIKDSLAWVYFKMGQQQKALQIILEALKRVPMDPVIHEHLGDIQKSLGNRTKAVEAYLRALDLHHPEPEKVKEKLRLIQ